MRRLSRKQFAAAAVFVVIAGGTGGAAFAATAQEAPQPAGVDDHATKGDPPPSGPAIIEPEEALSFAPPAGYEGLVESSEIYTFDEAVAAADALDKADPAPEGQQYLYGLTPDGSFGVAAVCVAGELPPHVLDRLEAAGASEEGVQEWECQSLYAKSAEGE